MKPFASKLIGNFISIFVLCLQTSAFAQSTDTLKHNALSVAIDPSLESVSLAPGATATVSVGQTRNTFAIKYSKVIKGGTVHSLGISAPFDERSDKGDILDFEGLGAAATLSIGISKTLWPSMQDRTTVNDYCTIFYALRDKMISDGDYSESEEQEIMNEFSSCNQDLIEKYYLAIPEDAGLPEIHKLNESWKEAFGYNRPIFGFGFQTSYSNPKFSYLDATTLDKNVVSENNYSISAVVNMLTVSKNNFIQLSLKKMRVSASRSTQVCSPIASSGSLMCSESFLGAPNTQEQTIAGFEFRKRYNRTAIGIDVARNLDEDVTLVSIPIYLNEIAGSNGYRTGVRLNWDSENKNTSATLFVGLFDLF